ncbi:MAG TPA: MBL fold metallo-hydrolase [Solirubrobacteraceae bacterium]|jgi:metal-dependent hydrolase (beta-lactamase superfamily II)|nr:MBL fold metallo-hydrolase [Solirubrobacteraceae bacterium]
MTSTLICGENEAVLVDALTTIAEAETLASWVALHHRNLTTIYITHGHVDHYAGLSLLLQRFPGARAIVTPRSAMTTTRSRSKATNCGSSNRATRTLSTPPRSTCHRSTSSSPATSFTSQPSIASRR